MNIGAKVLKTLTKFNIRRIRHHNQVGFTPGMQGWCNTYKLIIHLITKDKNRVILIDVEMISDKIE